MKLQFLNTLTEKNQMYFNDTQDITAKNLFLRFVAESNILGDLLTQSNAFYTLVHTLIAPIPSANDFFVELSVAVIDSFMLFVRSSPHVNITVSD